MKKMSEVINEMSAFHNRRNDALRDEIAMNEKADRERIITGAGLKPGGKSEDMFNTAHGLLDIILRSTKPYGAFIFTLSKIFEGVSQNKSANATKVIETLSEVFDSKELDNIIASDEKCREVKRQLEELLTSDTSETYLDEIKTFRDEVDKITRKYKKIGKLDFVMNRYCDKKNPDKVVSEIKDLIDRVKESDYTYPPLRD